MTDLLWALNNLISSSKSSMVTLKICKTEKLFEEVCKVLKESTQLQFTFMEQIFTLHCIVVDQIKNEELLYVMREFSIKTQEIAILLYD